MVMKSLIQIELNGWSELKVLPFLSETTEEKSSAIPPKDRKESTHHILMKPQTTGSSKCTATDIRSREFDLTSVATTAS